MVSGDFKAAKGEVYAVEEDEGPQVTSFAAMDASIAANTQLALAKRAEIEARPGGLASYKERVIFEPVVSDANHQTIQRYKAHNDGFHPDKPSKRQYTKARAAINANVEEFYQPYVASFPIKAEQEAQGGPTAPRGEGFFGIVTDRNFDKGLKEIHGEFREFMYIVRDPDTNKAIGGMNFAVYPPKDGQPLEGKYAGTVHLTYAFFDPEHRKLGLVRSMMDEMDRLAADYLKKVVPEVCAKSDSILNFSEQNIPDQMSPIDFMTDSSFAVHQVSRLETWRTMGYAELNFAGQAYGKYVQPALEEGGEVCDVLSFNAYRTKVDFKNNSPVLVGRERSEGVSAPTLKHHLSGFFGTSVVGTPDAGDPNSPNHDKTMVEAMTQLTQMGNTVIPTFGFQESMESLARQKPQIDEFLKNATQAEIHSGEQIGDLMRVREERGRSARTSNAPKTPAVA